MSTVTIIVDTERCVGSGTCMAIAPNLFQFDDEDRSQPVSETVSEETDVHTAIDMCPTAAITVLSAAESAVATDGSDR
ncbi:ferredoxin [Streptomyces sp. NPDC012461]|uniref:Ferredoxin n=2 Tax=unclassified Streptomyces TaxID=2593676 RepID=A0A6G3R100_9ACTN|nr:ferredoxin [Streptomyces sp. SID14436]NEC81650.1 ferredoxin [Streptomyces sp. SID7958]